jgi:hypothetical protein
VCGWGGGWTYVCRHVDLSLKESFLSTSHTHTHTNTHTQHTQTYLIIHRHRAQFPARGGPGQVIDIRLCRPQHACRNQPLELPLCVCVCVCVCVCACVYVYMSIQIFCCCQNNEAIHFLSVSFFQIHAHTHTHIRTFLQLFTGRPGGREKTKITPPSLAVAKWRPSGEKRTELTLRSWFSKL